MRKIVLLAVAAMTMLAFALPASASASYLWAQEGWPLAAPTSWSEDGAVMKGESASIDVSGTFGFTGSLGGVTCQADGNATLEPGTSGELDSVSLSSCSMTGTLATLCTKITAADATSQPWGLKATGSAGSHTISLTGLSMSFEFEGESLWCPKSIGVTGSLSLTPDDEAAIDSLSFAGAVTTNIGSAWATGTLNVDPAGKYGIVDKEERDIALDGWIRMHVYSGSLHCPATGAMTIETGDTAAVKEFDFDRDKCIFAGGLFCQEVTDVKATGLPWSASIVGEQEIEIAEAPMEASLKGGTGCPQALSATGNLELTTDSQYEISKTTVFGPPSWVGRTGELNWDPAGKYGILNY